MILAAFSNGRSALWLYLCWRDLEVGLFWDPRRRALYFQPLPCIGIC